MDAIEPISLVCGIIIGVLASYSVSDLVFSKDTTNEGDEV